MSNIRYTFDNPILLQKNVNLLYVSVSKYNNDWKSQPHTHYFAELFYVLKGSGNFIVENTMFPIQQHDLIIINPHIEHTEVSKKQTPLEYIVFGIEGLSFSFENKENTNNYFLYNYTSTKSKLLFILNLLLSELEEKEANYTAICQNILEILLIYITRTQNLDVISTLNLNISKECALVKRYIDSNYSDPITLETLAELTHMNKYYLAHSFTKYTGLSPINYLTKRRLESCKQLLITSSFSIAQIASCVGFSSISYLSQVFKKNIGISPNQYRKQHNFKNKVQKNQQENV